MGSNITGVPTVFLQNAGTSYNFIANATAGLAIHASTDSDTITVRQRQPDGVRIKRQSARPGDRGKRRRSGRRQQYRQQQYVLDITTSGTIALNSADDYLTVQLDAANTTLSLDHMKFIQAEGSGGSDTIIAGAAGQILTGGGAQRYLGGCRPLRCYVPGYGGRFLERYNYGFHQGR